MNSTAPYKYTSLSTLLEIQKNPIKAYETGETPRLEVCSSNFLRASTEVSGEDHCYLNGRRGAEGKGFSANPKRSETLNPMNPGSEGLGLGVLRFRDGEAWGSRVLGGFRVYTPGCV